MRTHLRNMHDVERWLSIAGGAALTAYGLGRRQRLGWMLATFGLWLLRRGASGHCQTYELLGVSTAEGSGMLPPHGDPLSHQLRGVRQG